jgi:hypothetical protein
MHNPARYAFYFFAGAVLITLIATAVFCRTLIARKKRAFFLLTGLVGDLFGNAIWFITFSLWGRVYVEGWHVFTREAWTRRTPNLALSDAMVFVVVGSLICMLPAWAVAYYYERQRKRNETPWSNKSRRQTVVAVSVPLRG